MGTRRQTTSEFLADQGFGQAGAPGVESFPEYPPHNALLAAYAQQLGAEDPRVQAVADMLRSARQQHELGQYDAEQQLLNAAYAQLQTAPSKQYWIKLLILAAAFATAWWWWNKNKGKKRRLPARRNRKRALPLDDDEDEDEDAEEDDE